MISVKKLLYGLDTRLNRVATNEHQSIPVEDKILSLQRSQVNLVKKKIGNNNLYRLGLDAFKKRYEDLQTLIVQEEKVPLEEFQSVYPCYTLDLNKLEHKYMFLINIDTLCSKGTCLNRLVSVSHIVKHADLPIYIQNSNYTPSFEYQSTIAVTSQNKVYIYTDGSFTPNEAYITYMRYPRPIDIEGYIDFDGNPSITQDCELNDYLEDELLDLSEQDLAMNTSNVSSLQNTQLRLNTNE